MSILSSIFGGDDSGKDVKRLMQENRALYDKLQTPTYDEYVPELYDNETAQYELTSEDPAIRAKQLEALSQLEDLSSEGLSDIDKAVFAQARGEADQIQRQGTQSALQDAQMRGVAGGGLEIALRESANQAGAQRANEMATQQAAAAAEGRRQALNAYATQSANVRGQDYNVNKGNTDVINQFNQLNTQNRNATGRANVDAKNSAVQYNQGMQTQDYNNKLAKINGQTGSNSQIANAYAAQSAANQADNNALLGMGTSLLGSYIGRKPSDDKKAGG